MLGFPMMKPLLFALATFSVTLPFDAQAGLALETPFVEVKPKPEDETTSVSFVFHNTGKKPVTVRNLESACSCLSASLDKTVYLPGEKGTGKAEFRVANFVGRHEKVIIVHTDDPEQPDWTVPFVLDIPALVQIEPKTVQWWVGDPVEPKTIRVKMTGDHPMRLLNITSTREAVEFSFKELAPGREYEITVRPQNTADVMMGALQIQTDSQFAKYQRQLAFFSVYRRPVTTTTTP